MAQALAQNVEALDWIPSFLEGPLVQTLAQFFSYFFPYLRHHILQQPVVCILCVTCFFPAKNRQGKAGEKADTELERESRLLPWRTDGNNLSQERLHLMSAARGWRVIQGKHKIDETEDVITQLSKLGQLEEEKKDRASELQGQWRKRTQEDREKILLVLLADDTSMPSTSQMGTATCLNYRFLLKQVCTCVPQNTLTI